jgi:indolepyruvate ferredoxin oxidoreductase
VRPNHFPVVNSTAPIDLNTQNIDLNKVLLPPRTWRQELKMSERFDATMAVARQLGINRIIERDAKFDDGAPAAIGFIVTGMGGPYLANILDDLGLAGAFPILQMGMSYPADVRMVDEFSKRCTAMVVIEERRSFLEKNIRDGLFHTLANDKAANLAGRLFGKIFPGGGEGIPDTRGLNYSVLAQRLIPLIKSTEQIPAPMRNGRLSAVADRLRKASKPKLAVFNQAVVARTPTFCPGCPHRDSSAALLELRKNLADPAYMQSHHQRKPVDLVAHGDTGCYTMLMFAPTEQLMHNYSGMGLGGGTGSGVDPFVTNKQIVFMGDGTFFHSGQVAISNSIKAGQDICYIILENKTTAMTGHQEHAGTELDVLGNRSYIQDIEAIVRAMAGTSPLTVEKLSPAERSKYQSTLERTILRDGVKVIIADKECGIVYHRRQGKEERKTIKKFGYLPRKTHMNITPEVCENCLECTKATACPGLTNIDTDYGKKIDTDLTLCVNDGACERVRTTNEIADGVKPCPSFEQITVVRSKRRRYMLPNMDLAKLPDPTPIYDIDATGEPWRVHMSGVGGMGIGVVGAILVRAGHKQGYSVSFQDKKGLAIRNGGVFSQITFTKEGCAPVSGSIPYGSADLLLGIDILEAARAIDPREQFRVASAERTAAVLNLHKQPTVYTLLGRDDFDPEQLRQQIMESCDSQHSYAKNLAEICEQRLGSKQFVNIMMLGVAFQLGLIPVSTRSIAWAIRDGIRRDHRRNLKAFNIGRKLALEPRVLPMKPEPLTWEQVIAGRTRIIKRTRFSGPTLARKFEDFVRSTIAKMPALPEESKYDLAIRIYDLMQYQDLGFASRYVDQIARVYQRDSQSRDYAATAAAIWGLAKVLLIKDEPYVAYLLTRYEKKQRDLLKYNIDVANGDKAIYRHHTSPEFNIGKMRFRFKITTTDWQLRIVQHMKWWRKIPGWHKREVAFAQWYQGLLDRIDLNNDGAYEASVAALHCVDEVTGYREVRYPKIEAAKLQAEAALSRPREVVRESEHAAVAAM